MMWCTRIVAVRRELKVLLVASVGVVVAFWINGGAWGAIIGINTPVTSGASVVFDDTNSIAPPAGVTNTGPATSPWTGAILTLSPTTDPNTGDTAQGSIDATFAGNNYALNFSGITVTQAPTNTGFANLTFTFNVEYQLDAAGLPTQATLFPNFIVNGTVQPSVGSFAVVSGFINYDAVNTAGTISTIETVNYNTIFNTPGPFTGTAIGIPVNGSTPALVPNTTLTLSGQIHFLVDPASISAESVQAVVPIIPEPGTLALLTLGSGVLATFRRRRVW
jgi:hypothetical protein